MATGNKQRRGGGGGEDVVDSVCSVIALVLVMVACIDLCDAATVLNVYRLIQYDLAGSPFGSRIAAVNHHAGSFPFAPSADLSRTIVILPLREVNVSFIREYIAQRKPLGGLLFLLPGMSYSDKEGFDGGDQNFEEELLRNVLVELEQLLIHSHLPYPVYFAYEDDDINAVLADVKKNDVTGQPATATMSGYKLVASVPEPKKIASPTTTNIQGWLRGLKGDGDSNQLPTIAIVASYDTFGAAPALSVGNDSNRSGIAALLEIARLFSLLYANPKTRGRYNLLFGLTSGGPYNYNGTDKWLRSFDQRVRESIDYAICLNNIGLLDNKLWIHVSKPPENALIKQILEDFSNVAEELNVVVGLKHKKINISNPRVVATTPLESKVIASAATVVLRSRGYVIISDTWVAWEHEQFSRFRVTAATLSGLSVAPGFLESSGGLLDRSNFASETAIIRSVKLVAESLARHIYAHQGRNIQIFVDNSSLAVNPSYVHSLLDLLSRTPRVAPFLSKHDPFIVALEKELSGHTAEVNVQHEVLDGMFTFFDNTRATLNIYQVASVTFDLLFVLVLGSYLIVLFSFLVITTRGLDDLISLFRRPPSRKVKNV